MKVITEEQKVVLKFAKQGMKEKSKLRVYLEETEVGVTTLFSQEEDYKNYGQLYSAVRTITKAQGKTFETHQLADRSGAVVTRTS